MIASRLTSLYGAILTSSGGIMQVAPIDPQDRSLPPPQLDSLCRTTWGQCRALPVGSASPSGLDMHEVAGFGAGQITVVPLPRNDRHRYCCCFHYHLQISMYPNCTMLPYTQHRLLTDTNGLMPFKDRSLRRERARKMTHGD